MGIDDFPRYSILHFHLSYALCAAVLLSLSLSTSGAYFFSNKWAGTEFPYVVHNNWIVGKANKLKRFKAFGVRKRLLLPLVISVTFLWSMR
jgi:hypothetical protein